MTAEPDVAELARDAMAGDRPALERLLARHVRLAHSVAVAAVGDWEEARDVVQAAFLTAVERLADCRDPGRFTGWLVAIVRNTGLNRRKVLGRERARRDPDHAIDGAPAPDEAAQHEARQALVAALRELPERQRQIVVLHDLEGWTHREIADILEISDVMSRQELFVARRAMRAALAHSPPLQGRLP